LQGWQPHKALLAQFVKLRFFTRQEHERRYYRCLDFQLYTNLTAYLDFLYAGCG